MRRYIVPVLAIAALSLTGCSSSTPTSAPSLESMIVAHEDVTLHGVTAALSLSPQPEGIEEGLPGYIALFQEDGSYQLLETSGMDVGQLEYTDGALFFSDQEHDYILGETLTTIESPKPNLQQALYVLGRSGTVVGLYNDGFTEDGYREVVVTVGDDVTESDATPVEGAYWLTSQCDDEIFGVAAVSGKYLTGSERERFHFGDGQVRHMLTRLFPGESEELIGISGSVMEDVSPGGLAPCVDRRIITPSYNVTGGLLGDGIAVLKVWDTVDGSLSETPFTFTSEEITLTADDVLFSKMAAEPVNGDLIWVLNDGRVLGTDIETGKTSVLTTTRAATPGANIFLDQRDGSMWSAIEPTQEAPDFVITKLDPEAGTSEEVFRVDGFGTFLSLNLIARDFVLF